MAVAKMTRTSILAAATLVFLLVAAAPVAAVTITVPVDYPTIQAAIDASHNGDTIVVRAGTYTEAIDFLGRAIVVKSESGPDVTVIDAGSSHSPTVAFEKGEGPDSVLDGFTVTHTSTFEAGRGIYCYGASPTITNNIITGNSNYGDGAGIYCRDSNPVISSNVIAGNESTDRNGGGIGGLHSSPLISNCTIVENRADDDGGGIHLDYAGYLRITDCIIGDNFSDSQGGGIKLRSHYHATIENCTFTRNRSTYSGGGIAAFYGSTEIVNCTVTDNSSGLNGGGINVYCYLPHHTTISCTTIAGNSASGEGGGLFHYGDSPGTIVNTILWGNTAPLAPDFCDLSGTVATYCDIGGGWPGTGNFDADPLHADAAGGDYHLTSVSPCVNAGDPGAILPGIDFDIEGDPRIVQGYPDVGSDEFYAHLWVKGDLFPGGAFVIRAAGSPGYPVLLGQGTSLLPSPTMTQYGPLLITTPPILILPLGSIPSRGILSIPATVPVGWGSGWSFYYQALVGPPGVPFTKLTNALTFVVE